jgi:hypothetical protein
VTDKLTSDRLDSPTHIRLGKILENMPPSQQSTIESLNVSITSEGQPPDAL